jgi:hypothetical protein
MIDPDKVIAPKESIQRFSDKPITQKKADVYNRVTEVQPVILLDHHGRNLEGKTEHKLTVGNERVLLSSQSGGGKIVSSIKLNKDGTKVAQIRTVDIKDRNKAKKAVEDLVLVFNNMGIYLIQYSATVNSLLND